MSQQWEYFILTTSFHTVPLDPPVSMVYAGVTFCQTPNNITKHVEQKEIPAVRKDPTTEAIEVVIEPRELTQVVARLGMAGWEMLNTHLHRDNLGTINILFFKRPVEPGRAIDDGF
jgi:hypothetical protein